MTSEEASCAMVREPRTVSSQQHQRFEQVSVPRGFWLEENPQYFSSKQLQDANKVWNLGVLFREPDSQSGNQAPSARENKRCEQEGVRGDSFSGEPSERQLTATRTVTNKNFLLQGFLADNPTASARHKEKRRTRW